MRPRQVIGAQILADPGNYCVCEGCGSILVARLRRACPACGGYKFDASEARVIAQATLLASRPSESVVDEDMV